MPLAALTTVLVFTFDRQEDALVAGLWRCAEIVAGVAVGLVLTAIPFPVKSPERVSSSTDDEPKTGRGVLGASRTDVATAGDQAKSGEESSRSLHVFTGERDLSPCQELEPRSLDADEEEPVSTMRETKSALVVNGITDHSRSFPCARKCAAPAVRVRPSIPGRPASARRRPRRRRARLL